jgi:hypothetical protein
MSDTRRNEPPPLGPVDAGIDPRQSRWSQIVEPLDALQRWLPADPLQEGSQAQSSDSIGVNHYELTLLWPLLLREYGKEEGTPDPHRLERWAQTIVRDGVWEETDSTDLSSKTGYSEFLYFHPFVRNFLYPNRDDLKRGAPPKSSGLRVFCRPDVRTIAAEVYVDPNHNERFVLDARRVELYVFATSVAILAVHLTPAAQEAPLSLGQVLRIQDVLRRLHAPYWESPYPTHFAGHCPLSLEIVSGRGDGRDTVWRANFGKFNQADASDTAGRRAVAEQLDNVARHREPLPVLPWRKMIEPLRPVTAQEPAESCLQYVQIEDERMQVLSYLAVPDPRAISAGDWVRLATVDESGDSRFHPYSPGFLKASGGGDGFRGFAYDRFWDPQGAPPANYDLTSTRWLCCGYGFAAVGSSSSRFFTDDSAGALAHFRHHYFKLALIAHFHRASLLGFKQVLSSMLDARRDSTNRTGSNEARFSRDLTALREEFLSFRNRYWFIEVSNQIQGRELFDLWAHHLNTRSLFADVAAEIHEATNVRQAARLEDTVEKIAEMQTNVEWVELFIVGAYALELAHVVPLVIRNDDPWFTVASAALVIVSTLLVAWAIRPWKHERSRFKKWIIGILAVVILGFGIFTWVSPPTHGESADSDHNSAVAPSASERRSAEVLSGDPRADRSIRTFHDGSDTGDGRNGGSP